MNRQTFDEWLMNLSAKLSEVQIERIKADFSQYSEEERNKIFWRVQDQINEREKNYNLYEIITRMFE